MIIFKSINNLKKKVNFSKNIGFVPTMGAIHEGHLSLINQSKKKCEKTVVSIFINPKQFNNKLDFKNYPRNLNKDIKLLKKFRVDYLLLPKYDELFRVNLKKKIRLKNKDRILCAKYRPGHFEGVLHVINQYLNLIQPKFIFLGEKDYQQYYLISNFIKDKFITKSYLCKTIRQNNLYALSSRNKLLKNKDLHILKSVSVIIKKFYSSIKKEKKNIKNLNLIKNLLERTGINLEYLEIRNKINFSKKITKRNFKIFVAYYYKKIRFIDNF